MPHRIRAAQEPDLAGVAAIYDHEALTSIATFDLAPQGLDYWRTRLASSAPGDHFLVAVADDGGIDGYAYSSAYRPRPAYARTRETSVYLAERARGQGLGRALYRALLDLLADDDVHTVVAVIALPNPASEALHVDAGFRRAGTMTEIGHKFGRWVDTAWYERHLSGPVETDRERLR